MARKKQTKEHKSATKQKYFAPELVHFGAMQDLTHGGISGVQEPGVPGEPEPKPKKP